LHLYIYIFKACREGSVQLEAMRSPVINVAYKEKEKEKEEFLQLATSYS